MPKGLETLLVGGKSMDRDKIREALLNGDKRGFSIFAEGRDREKLRLIRATEWGREMVHQLQDEAEHAILPSPELTFSMLMEFERTGNRLIYETAYFGRRRQLFTLVLLYLLDQDERLLPFIEQKLWEWCELYSWELPAHFASLRKLPLASEDNPAEAVGLFAAETAFFFAELLFLLRSELSPFLVLRLEEEIHRRVIMPYLSRSYWWEEARMNWSAVCAGSIGAAAIYLIRDVKVLTDILERVIGSLNEFIQAFDQDGLIVEGLTYWEYGVGFYTMFSELLRERTCEEMDLLLGEKIRRIAELPQILQFPSGSYVNFSDAGDAVFHGNGGIQNKLSQHLNISSWIDEGSFDLYSDSCYRFGAMLRKLLWSPTAKPSRQQTGARTGCFVFRESGWLVDRRYLKGEGEACKHFAAFAGKGGHNGEPHNHNDLGSFILHIAGEELLTEIGSPEYVKEYFVEETRYSFLAASSLGHSVPIINGEAQAPGEAHRAQLLEAGEQAGKTRFQLQLCQAYACPALLSFERVFEWQHEKGILKLQDTFEWSCATNKITEIFMTRLEPILQQQGRLRINGKNIAVEFEYSPSLVVSIEKFTYRDHSGNDSSMNRILFTADADTRLVLDFTISPVTAKCHQMIVPFE